MFDWSNRVIGWQDPDYARRRRSTAPAGRTLAREALALRPEPDADGRMPDPRTASRHARPLRLRRLLAEEQARALPATTSCRSCWRSATRTGAATATSASRSSRTSSGSLPSPATRPCATASPEDSSRCSSTPSPASTAGRAGRHTGCGGGDAALVDARHGVSPDGDARHRAAGSRWRRRQGRRVLRLGQPRRGRLRATPTASTSGASPEPTWPSAAGRTSASAPTSPGCRCARSCASCSRRTVWIESAGEPVRLRSNFQRGVKRLPIRWTV